MFQPSNSKNHMIKITQLNSTSNNQTRNHLSTPSSPCKQFQLKKVSEVKQKSAFQSFNVVEVELRPRQSPLRKERKETFFG